MNTKLLEHAEELQKTKAQLAQAEQEITAYDMTMNRQSKLIAELQAQLEAVGAGGVSTLIPTKQCSHEFYRFGDQKERRCNWCSFNESQAATANPPVAVPAGMPKPARVPLDAVQMAAGRESIFSTGNPYCPCDSKTFRKVAEWVERHHGITEPQGGTND